MLLESKRRAPGSNWFKATEESGYSVASRRLVELSLEEAPRYPIVLLHRIVWLLVLTQIRRALS